MKMNPKPIFDFSDYRAYIKFQIDAQPVPRGHRSRLAEVAGCQPAYLSQVLSGNANLTSDQASNLADYWQLDERESEYLLTLVDLEKAASPSLKRRLKSKLKAIKEGFRKEFTTYQQPSVDEKSAAELYYSTWIFSAIHVLLSIEHFQNTSMLAKHLGMSESEVLGHLRTMQEHGLAQPQNSNLAQWRQTQRHVHAASGSFHSGFHHRNWRLKAIDALTPKRPNNLHYTAIYSLSEADFLAIREVLLSSIDQTRAIVEPSREESAACLVVDWIKI